MKSNWKKLLSLALVLALMLGFAPGMDLTARADDSYTSLKNTTTVITFDSKEWYLIDYDDSTVTLLSKECVGASKYNPDQNYDSTYSGSTVESFVNSWYTEHISEDAKAAVNGSGMFLLTKDQANNLSTDVLKCSPASGAYNNSSYWWLCSPGSTNSSAARVNGDTGTVAGSSGNVWIAFGVRPALKLDLNKVVFSDNTFALPAGSAAGGTATEYAALVNTTTTVRFNNMDWYIIADESTAADAGTVTLLAKDPIGALRFNDRSSSSASVYAESEVKEYLDGFATGTGSFAGVADAIAATDLTDVSVTGAKLYLLNQEEANALPMEIRKCAKAASAQYNQWWLRTPSSVIGSEGCKGAYIVDGAQGFLQEDTGVQYVMGVRPALRLDLSKVTFSNNTFALPVPPVASVTTSGGTTTEYTTFSAALDAWADDATLTLLSDVTTSSTISVSGAKTLDLNGYGITMTGSGSVINVGGASLTLNDSAPNALHKYTIQNPKSNGAGLAVVDDANGTQTFTGGYITGGDTNDRGGGVVVNGGSLTMNGGTVIGNNAANHGGGVALKELGGTFIMNGGALIGNTGKYGGGLSMINASSGTVNGGKIQYNCTSKNGGGIHTDCGNYGSLTVTGGAITNNYCDGSTESGGGVLVSGMTFNLSGSVEIKDNLRKSGADNLCLVAGNTVIVADTLSNSTPIGVTMKTPGVFTNTASDKVSFNDATRFVSDDAGYAVFQNSSGQLELRVLPVASVTSGGQTAEYTTFADALGAWADGSTLTLLSDVTTDSTISVSGAKKLDLNGYGIKATGTGYSVITVGSGANLTLNDSRPTETTHYFTVEDPAPNGAGLAVVDDANGTTSFTGGYITGGTSAAGGGIYANGGTIHVNGGTIIGNQTTEREGGGGICVKDGTLRMTGGAVTANYAYLERGAQGGGISLLGNTQFAISGGVISYNWADGENGCGGGVQGNNSGSDTITGGEVFNNYAKHGGGFNVLNTLTATGGVIRGNIADNGGGVRAKQVILSGSATIQDNLKRDSAKSDIFLYGNHLITLNSVLSEANSNPIAVGIYQSGVGEFTNSTNPAFNDASKFISDNASYAVGKNADGQLFLGAPVTVTFDTKGGSAVDAQTVASGSLVTEPAAPTKTNDTFAGWYTDETYTTAFDFGTMIIDTDTTLCAQWASKPVHTVSGTVKQGDAAVSGVDVRLVQGTSVIAVTVTNANGEFSFSASDGIYNIIATTDDKTKTKTELITLDSTQTTEITMPTENVNSTLTVTGNEIKNVMVGGLDELAEASGESGQAVTVTMTVVEKSDAENASELQSFAKTAEHPNQSVECLEISIQKTVGSASTEITDTNNVLEIVVPYRFTGKKDVEVYRYHGSVEKLKKEDSKADGTYQTDENNGLIYIYASKFSTYAIGYTQLYTVACPIKYGSYTGTVTVSLLDASDNVVASHAIDVNNGSGTYSFTHVPEGTYTLRAVWAEGGKETTLEQELNVCTTD